MWLLNAFCHLPLVTLRDTQVIDCSLFLFFPAQENLSLIDARSFRTAWQNFPLEWKEIALFPACALCPTQTEAALGRSASPTIRSRDWYRFSRAAGFFFTPNGMEIAEMKKPRSYFTTGNYDNSRLAPIKKHNPRIYQNVRCWSDAVLLISERVFLCWKDHFLTACFQLPGAEMLTKSRGCCGDGFTCDKALCDPLILLRAHTAQ